MGGRRWEDVPMDCLVFIFSKLGLEDLTVGVPFVCKSWNGAAKDPLCWRTLDFQNLNLAADSRFAEKFKREFHAQSFSFSSLFRLAIARSHGSATKLFLPPSLSSGENLQQDLIWASTRCPRLKELSLPTLHRRDDEHIPKLITQWKELEELEMKWKPVSFLETLEAMKLGCPNIAELRLSGFFNVRDADAIAKCLPKLQRLKMTGSFLRKEVLLRIMEGCRELQAVHISSCRGFEEDDDEVLKKAKGMKRFHCVGCRAEQDCGLYGGYSELFLSMIIGY
ncbi:F-box/LRR-repeat protein [Apostasia shenzhenica]|uniref:F-box/LRR-repeat protein n=1 Tax=Apostasia shenzhenica TaxID=1088818 RepID=A0A2I0BDZ9_9ASPA|nr:F-box/LRR-repeat protein [Apostasia shenzhenica]